MSLYQWSEQYSVGDATMDAHHQRLFEIIDQLHRAVDEDQGEAAVGEAIAELLAYTRYHFDEEERMLEALGYPTLDAHKALHRQFVDSLLACQADLERGATRVAAIKLLTTAAKWLRDHIMSIDQGYSVLLEQGRQR